MKHSPMRGTIGFAVALLAWTACSGGSNGVPSAVQGLQAPLRRVSDDAKALQLSGQYTGTTKDITYGTGKSAASYTQYKNAIGGVLAIKYKSAAVALSVAVLAKGTSVDGTSVATSGSLYCTYSTTATYDTKTSTLSGSYKAVQGCSGGRGTFTLKHECYYKGTRTEDIRPEVGGRPC